MFADEFPTPVFSVVIPTFNRRNALRECLQALAVQTLPPGGFEVIVVVDGSGDGTGEMLATLAPPFRLLVLTQENRGAGAARNTGAARATGAILALTEDDVLPREDWLANADRAFRQIPLDVLEGKTVYHGTSEEVRRLEGERQPSFIPCNLFVRATAFRAVGGYSDEFHDSRRKLYFREDSDFGFRLLDAGFRVGMDDSVVVSHPRQWPGLWDAFRHARRYVFDPLLARRHPRRYRESIEVKRIMGLRIRRVHHSIALISVAGLITTVVGLISGSMPITAVGLATVIVCGLLYKIKYQGLTVKRSSELFGFILVPFVYLYSLLRGCLRYRSWRVLL